MSRWQMAQGCRCLRQKAWLARCCLVTNSGSRTVLGPRHDISVHSHNRRTNTYLVAVDAMPHVCISPHLLQPSRMLFTHRGGATASSDRCVGGGFLAVPRTPRASAPHALDQGEDDQNNRHHSHQAVED